MSCHEELPSGLGWHLCPRGWPGLGWRALGLHAARCLPGQCRWCTLPLRLSASREHSQTGGMAVICSQHCCGAERLFQSQHFTGSSVPRQYRTLQNIRGLWREAERASRDRGYPLLLRNVTIALCKEGFRDSSQVQRSCHEVHAVLLNILMRGRCNAGIVRVGQFALRHARVSQVLCRVQQALHTRRQRGVPCQQRGYALQQETLRCCPIEGLCASICMQAAEIG